MPWNMQTELQMRAHRLNFPHSQQHLLQQSQAVASQTCSTNNNAKI